MLKHNKIQNNRKKGKTRPQNTHGSSGTKGFAPGERTALALKRLESLEHQAKVFRTRISRETDWEKIRRLKEHLSGYINPRVKIYKKFLNL